MKPAEAIEEARRAIAVPGLPQDLQTIAFQEVLRYYLGSTPQVIQPVDPPAGRRGTGGAEGGLARLASTTGISESALADLFDVDGDVALHIGSSRIDASKSKATGQVALLIAAARQGGGIDDSWTAVAHIRDILKQYNRYDPNNFSAYLRKVDDYFNFRGKAPAQEVRLTKPGWEAAIELMSSLAG
jgi:hypothetical protein